ncbi:putative leucine-rich repeat receptor-like serine/threonine-protein kinase At2g19230 isoform X1 [Typha latifolia]|uniref:putative leucine-rich repeat receptor-like serine/threonine-protein kinase At2g19230 isoform X1 n=1 Tax=Typha latifolia TaxID=4733 RepID=UPI003C30BC5E
MGYLNLEKKMMLWCRSLLLGVLIAAVQVNGQTPTSDGFISIDCGATANSTDSITGIPYITDDQFIETGVKYNVSSTNYLNSSLPKQYSTVRSFPDGDRNCYSLKPAILDNKYLLRASFFYGNYDGKNSGWDNSPLLFDLYIGSGFWKTVNISDPSIPVTYEAITAISAYHPLLPVCLIRSDSSSTPFISLLEMRLLKNTLFPGDLPDYGNFIKLFMRRNLGASGDKIIRFPDDPYDRIWEPMNITLHELSTDKTVKHGQFDQFEVPSVVLQTASVSAGVNDSIQFYVNPASHIAYFVILHFSELELLPEKDVREVDVYLDGFSGNYTANYAPIYLKSGSVYHPQVVLSQYLFSLNASKRATRPPILNALEIYSGISQSFGRQSNLADVEAILKIKEAYKTMNKNWVGDPCVPVSFPWAGLSCRKITEEGGELRITAINLSSSGLVGEVSYFFSELTEIRVLDLSYNNLSGRIPNSLAGMPYLGVLNLTGNCITQVPEGLVEKSKEGSLILRFDNNTDTCDGSNPTPGGNSTPSSNSTTATNKKITAPIVIVLSVVPAFLLLVVVVLILWRIRRKTQAINHEVVQPLSESWQFNVDLGGSQLQYTSHQSSVDHKDNQLHFGSRQFMYAELENITKKFSRTIGKGGFGTVFHGSLEDGTEVAVKICSLSSKQAPNLFLAEVENLSSVRHKNLVSLVGYCMDSGQMAIVYEYMPLGSLDDHLRGKAGIGRVLNWAERLQIIIDAAQGLDYLYNGCPMPIIHRDIKTSNILLGQNLEAKISDFGLSKAFHSDLQSHVSMTAPAFSLGYIDPMCLKTWKFNEKTDVYSFGVVLLEIITGEPPVRHDRDVQLIERVQLSFEAGDINAIVDPKLQGMYNTESVWKVLELAMRCMARDVDQRPKMAEVVTQLRESLECETSEKSKSMTTESQSMAFMKKSTIFDPAAR